MGGMGSGRWLCHTKKTTVEESRTLDVGYFAKMKDIFIEGQEAFGHVATRGLGVVWRFNWLNEAGPILRLEYSARGQAVEMSIPLQRTAHPFGYDRWWFTCPLVVNGGVCTRRTAKLYLPPRGRYFGCRHCYSLTYKSAQEAHAFESLCKLFAGTGMDPELARLLSRPPTIPGKG